MDDFETTSIMTSGHPDAEFAPTWVPGVFNETVRQRALSALDIVNREPEERFDRITKLAAQLLHTKSAAVILILDEHIILKSRFGMDAIDQTDTNAIGAFVLRTPKCSKSSMHLKTRDSMKIP